MKAEFYLQILGVPERHDIVLKIVITAQKGVVVGRRRLLQIQRGTLQAGDLHKWLQPRLRADADDLKENQGTASKDEIDEASDDDTQQKETEDTKS